MPFLTSGHPGKTSFVFSPKIEYSCIPKLEQTIQAKPNEDDYEDDDEYEQAYDNYRESIGEIKENLMFQTHYAMNLFDNKQVREKTLTQTKRAKEIS